MADPDSVRDLVARYIDAVEQAVAPDDDPLDATRLHAIAMEVGLTTAELERADQAASDHATRSRGYLSQHLWDAGIGELALATALRPDDIDLRRSLASAHADRWLAMGDLEDRRIALRLAHGCVQADPADAASFALIAALQRRRPLPRGIWAAAIGGIAIVTVGGAIAVQGAPEDAQPDSQPPGGEALAIVAPEVVSPEVVSPEVVSPGGEDDGAVPLEWDRSDRHDWTPRVGTLSSYSSGTWAYVVQGRLHNVSDRELSHPGAQLALWDASGNIVAKVTRQFGDRQIHYRPGDSVEIRLLVHQGGPPPAAARITLSQADWRPAPAAYPPASAIAVDWSGIAVPGAWDITAHLRSLHISDHPHSFGEHKGKIAHRPTLAIENQGAVLEHLKARIIFSDDAGEALGQRDFYAVGPMDPPLWPEDTHLTQQIVFLPRRAATVRLEILEAR